MKKVLIVEDEEMTAGLLQQAVDHLEGFESKVIDSLQEVQAECAANPFPYDCALFDVEIYEQAAPRAPNSKPSRDWGIEALPILGGVLDKDRIVILTHFSGMIREKLSAMGYGERVFAKGIHSEKLEKELRRMCGV